MSKQPPPIPAWASGQGQSDEAQGLSSRYFRIQDLRRLRQLFFSSRRVVEGHYAGRHASPQRGHSVEFNDFRQYMPGDELGDIDWKLYARSDKLFIKLFEHQSDMTVNLLVDGSASMSYSGLRRDGQSKYDLACKMAAAIAFLTTKQQDKVSLAIARQGIQEFQRPHGGFGHFVRILRSMERNDPAGQADLAASIAQLAGRIGRKGLLVVFSDLLDEPAPILDAAAIFTHRGSEVILFHILHADELKLPDLDDAVFVDSETTRRLSLNVGDVRAAYEKRLGQYLSTWSSMCRGRGVDYRLVSTAMNYQQALEEYLFQRASMV